MTTLADSALKRFQEAVWDFVCSVPTGRVVTYGQVAQALAACPDAVPWHRVVNARGRLSGHATADRQRQRLALEGVEVVSGQLDLHRVQWQVSSGEGLHPQASLF